MKRSRWFISLSVTILVVTLTMVGFGRRSIVYGRGGGLSLTRLRALPPDALNMTSRARSDLARKLATAPDRLVLRSVDPVNFPDSSLGVIEPGRRVLQATTPGYALAFVADATTYTYHGSGDRVVQVSAEEEREAVVQRLIRLSVSDLRNRLNVDLNEIVLQSIAETEFPDGSLGSPEPNIPYPLGPTPGYDIRLQVKGVVYRYWTTGDRVVYAGSFLEPVRWVTVFLHKASQGDQQGCLRVYPLLRSVPVTPAASSVVALEQLFAGPTSAELAQGYASPFSDATSDALRGIAVEDRTAYVDLEDIRSLVPMDSSVCGREAFLSEVEATLREVLPVEWVAYSIDGDVMVFYQWIKGLDMPDPISAGVREAHQ